MVDIAVSAGSFKTLVTAVQAASLVDTLKSPGPFTVFAPNDDAFATPTGNYTNPGAEYSLAKNLTYHVVPGKLMKAELRNSVQLPQLKVHRSRLIALMVLR